MVTPEERKSWGPLGRMPEEVIMGSKEIRERWFALNERAVRCRAKRDSDSKIAEAKQIEHEYYSILQMAKQDANDRTREGSKT